MGPLATYLRVHTSTAAGQQPRNRHTTASDHSAVQSNTHSQGPPQVAHSTKSARHCSSSSSSPKQPQKNNPSPEAHFLLPKAPPVLKRLWCDHFHHRQVLGRGLQVLPQCEDVDTAILQVKHGIYDLVIC